MWNWNTLCKIYSFLLFVKYKLQNKILDHKLLNNDIQTKHSKYSNELFSRTDKIISLIFEKLADYFNAESCDIIIDRGMNPVHFILSKLTFEKSLKNKDSQSQLKSILKANFDKFEYQNDLYSYLKSLNRTREVVDDIFETT